MQSLILEICDCPSAFSFASPKENEPGWISISLRPSLNRPNGEELVNILLEKGDRNIGLIGWEQGDATWLGRWEGYKAGVELHRPLRNSGEFVLLFTFLTQGVFSADIKS